MQTQYITIGYETAMYDDRADFVHSDLVQERIYELEFLDCEIAG